MHALAAQGHANATALASGHLDAGHLDGCFEWLNRAVDQREPIITTNEELIAIRQPTR